MTHGHCKIKGFYNILQCNYIIYTFVIILFWAWVFHHLMLM